MWKKSIQNFVVLAFQMLSNLPHIAKSGTLLSTFLLYLVKFWQEISKTYSEHKGTWYIKRGLWWLIRKVNSKFNSIGLLNVA